MRPEKIEDQLEVPEGVTAKLEGRTLVVQGPKGEIKRDFAYKKLNISMEGNKLSFSAKKPSRREKNMLYTYIAHMKNMFKGVVEGHHYKLKVCSGHFPMTVAVSGNKFVVKNFLGEKVPRELDIKEGATVKVDGDQVLVDSTDKEISGQVAADIEQLTRITNKDNRIFQDGIYITEKSGKTL